MPSAWDLAGLYVQKLRAKNPGYCWAQRRGSCYWRLGRARYPLARILPALRSAMPSLGVGLGFGTSTFS